jgi:hypothetical protein
MKTEPVILLAAIVALVQAIPLGLQIFGVVEFSAEALAYLETLIILMAAIPAAFFARSKVSPVSE